MISNHIKLTNIFALKKHFSRIFLILVLCLSSQTVLTAPAGYSKYFIPGAETDMLTILEAIGVGSQGSTTHVIIGVTSWSKNTTLCYDHWEDGYEYDPLNPGSATCDETVALTAAAPSHTFESANVDPAAPPPANCNTTGTCNYDGRDIIYAIGGAVTVSRSSWAETTGTVLALAWEVYPVTPQLTSYILPFGEDLAAPAPGPNLQDFNRVFALIQATENNTTINIYDKNGAALISNIVLQQGQVYRLDDSKLAAGATLNTGTRIEADKTIQMHYVIGELNSQYEIRGLAAFPRGFWSKEYYAPVPSFGNAAIGNVTTEIYLYNPHSTALTINYEMGNGTTGSVSVPALDTIALTTAAGGASIPTNSAIYLNASDVFWGISTIDKANVVYDWAYSLVPRAMLTNEHYLAWAPGSTNAPTGGGTGDENDSGVFIAPAQDAIRVFVDYDSNGTVDQTYNLGRLQSQYIFDPNDGDMSNAHIWATGPYVAAYGQNADTAAISAPAIDVGYTMLPSLDTDIVIKTGKSADPVMVPAASGSQTTFTLTVDSSQYAVDNLSADDLLPAGWTYISGSTTITRADLTTLTGAAADPAITGSTLSWSSAQLLSLAPRQTLTIQYKAQTSATHTVGDVTENRFTATGTRTVQGITQTFASKAFAFNTFGNLQINKTSTAGTPLFPGDNYSYTITVTNPSGSTATYNNVALYDPLPPGISYVAGTSQVTAPVAGTTSNVLDTFSIAAYNNNDGNINWAGNWIETGDDGAAATGNIGVQYGVQHALFLDAWFGGNTALPRSLCRTIDASAYVSANLSYDYQLYTGTGNSPDPRNHIDVYIKAGGQPDRLIASHETPDSNGAINGGGSISQAIPSSYLTANTKVCFQVTSGFDTANGDALGFTNVRVDVTTAPGPGTATVAAGSPPNWVDATQKYALGPGQSLTLSYQIRVDNPLATGIDQIRNTVSVTTVETVVPLAATVTNTVNNPSTASARVGDRIWLDTNGNGTPDVGEPGLGNIILTLKDQYGTPIATTTSDSNGFYLFSSVQAGNGYYVEATSGLPSGLTQSAPAGRSDNRTNAFNLNAGQNYIDADLGYTSSGTAALGDRIWSDANGDGIQDAGEPGLAGITVQLWQDDGDGVFDSTKDTLINTTVSAASGAYLFAGVTASGIEDYWLVTDAAHPPAGYSYTTHSAFLYQTVNAGDVIVTADFGFQNTASTYRISDRVWFDQDGSGGVNGSEGGLAGVTVALLDASLNVIASTTTDSNGNFSFTGVAGGNYTVNITDTGGILTDYYGTTTAAINNQYSITALASDLDNTSAPSFGYNLTRSIGDTIFNDLNGNGIQDNGEPAISGVTVELQDGVCTPGSNCPTVISNNNGHYLFSGLNDGAYTIAIDGTQTALSGYTLTTADDGPAGSPHTRNVTLSGGISQLAVDYGYRTSAATSVSGTIWNDLNQDGIIDANEAGIQNVSLDILNGTTVVAHVTTDASGYYSFTGLPANAYTVKITDTQAVLNGFNATAEGTGSPAISGDGSVNGQEPANTTGGNVSGLVFGFFNPTPTLAKILHVTLSAVPVSRFIQQAPVKNEKQAALAAYLDPDGDGIVAVLHWETLNEIGTIGFYVERLDNSGWRRINDQMLPGLITAPLGGQYQLADPEAETGADQQYRIIEQEAWGNRRSYGPYRVHAQ